MYITSGRTNKKKKRINKYYLLMKTKEYFIFSKNTMCPMYYFVSFVINIIYAREIGTYERIL